jgi:hypothetical protein
MKKTITSVVAVCLTATLGFAQNDTPKCISGIYPRLAYFNHEGECGTGAVVPWADKLWVITYGPHKPFGSSDKLYEIGKDKHALIRPESIGGTPANRMIHRESNQLFVGPYAIDDKGNVRVIPISEMPGRLTGMTRSLNDPKHKVVIATMEEGIYEVDVNSLKVNTWFKDGNQLQHEGAKTYHGVILEGAHGKGFYSGQGLYFFANNGENSQEALTNPRAKSGILGEYDGKTWKTVRRNQFTEITGPGGIYGNPNPGTDPIWTLGWDYKSILLGTRDAKQGWTFYRLPKASNSYDGAHGWNTEWPRIRNVGTDSKPDLLMTMHGMFWHFPKTFSRTNTAGIRPLSSYLKVIGDFCRWDNQLVFGCDDSAQSEFLNKRKAKGGIAGPGQSQSNLWFTSLTRPSNVGTTDAAGSVWQKESVAANATSDAFLMAGWNRRTAWLKNEGAGIARFTYEVDAQGNNQWKKYCTRTVAPGQSVHFNFDQLQGQWIRVKTANATSCTASFVYSDSRQRATANSPIFNGIATIKERDTKGGILYALGNDRHNIGILANKTINGTTQECGYYEMDENMTITKKDDKKSEDFIRTRMSIPANVITADKASYLITDDAQRRWRLPFNDSKYNELIFKCRARICREVATERDLFNCGGTFYELPAENADGYAKIRPICTHNLQINDYASYRGMLVISGISNISRQNDHIFTSSDGLCSVWAGTIDDLWNMGKPVGQGGPWKDDDVTANTASDPYLIGHYDNKTLKISHKSSNDVTITAEVDPTGDGVWMAYDTYTVKPGEEKVVKLPKGNFAKWIRFKSNQNTNITTWLIYE